MQFLPRYLAITLIAWTLVMLLGQPARAHLMVAQHGTLNVVNDDVFMVLSLPISAFDTIDDDSDGTVTMVEFNNHRGAIVQSIRENITLGSGQENASLQGLMLSPVRPHDITSQEISQLAVMGRFSLHGLASDLRFHLGLFGTQVAERSMEITVTRNSDKHKAVFELTPGAPARLIFSGES